MWSKPTRFSVFCTIWVSALCRNLRGRPRHPILEVAWGWRGRGSEWTGWRTGGEVTWESLFTEWVKPGEIARRAAVQDWQEWFLTHRAFRFFVEPLCPTCVSIVLPPTNQEELKKNESLSSPPLLTFYCKEDIIADCTFLHLKNFIWQPNTQKPAHLSISNI